MSNPSRSVRFRLAAPSRIAKLLRSICIALIHLYQRGVSPFLPDACIYIPSCSQYAVEAIEKYGLGKGCWLAVRRIVRCTPWHVGGYDPVP